MYTIYQHSSLWKPDSHQKTAGGCWEYVTLPHQSNQTYTTAHARELKMNSSFSNVNFPFVSTKDELGGPRYNRIRSPNVVCSTPRVKPHESLSASEFRPHSPHQKNLTLHPLFKLSYGPFFLLSSESMTYFYVWRRIPFSRYFPHPPPSYPLQRPPRSCLVQTMAARGPLRGYTVP